MINTSACQPGNKKNMKRRVCVRARARARARVWSGARHYSLKVKLISLWRNEWSMASSPWRPPTGLWHSLPTPPPPPSWRSRKEGMSPPSLPNESSLLLAVGDEKFQDPPGPGPFQLARIFFIRVLAADAYFLLRTGHLPRLMQLPRAYFSCCHKNVRGIFWRHIQFQLICMLSKWPVPDACFVVFYF